LSKFSLNLAAFTGEDANCITKSRPNQGTLSFIQYLSIAHIHGNLERRCQAGQLYAWTVLPRLRVSNINLGARELVKMTPPPHCLRPNDFLSCEWG
jgi:hypothetical protein